MSKPKTIVLFAFMGLRCGGILRQVGFFRERGFWGRERGCRGRVQGAMAQDSEIRVQVSGGWATGFVVWRLALGADTVFLFPDCPRRKTRSGIGADVQGFPD
jgi:hypothetical protein